MDDRGEQLNKCRGFLKSHNVAVIASASPDAQPHAATINYLSDDDCNLFFIAREHTRKYENITHNPHVWVVIGDRETVTSVEVRGPARLIEDDAKTTKLLSEFSKVVRRHSPWPLPIMRMHGSEAHLFELTPVQIAYADFRPSRKHEGEYFELQMH